MLPVALYKNSGRLQQSLHCSFHPPLVEPRDLAHFFVFHCICLYLVIHFFILFLHLPTPSSYNAIFKDFHEPRFPSAPSHPFSQSLSVPSMPYLDADCLRTLLEFVFSSLIIFRTSIQEWEKTLNMSVSRLLLVCQTTPLEMSLLRKGFCRGSFLKVWQYYSFSNVWQYYKSFFQGIAVLHRLLFHEVIMH